MQTETALKVGTASLLWFVLDESACLFCAPTPAGLSGCQLSGLMKVKAGHLEPLGCAPHRTVISAWGSRAEDLYPLQSWVEEDNHPVPWFEETRSWKIQTSAAVNLIYLLNSKCSDVKVYCVKYLIGTESSGFGPMTSETSCQTCELKTWFLSNVCVEKRLSGDPENISVVYMAPTCIVTDLCSRNFSCQLADLKQQIWSRLYSGILGNDH